MTPRKAEALCLLIPLILVVPLLWRDIASGSFVPNVLSPSGLAALALGGAALALGARYFIPGYSIEPNRWGLVAGLAGVLVYFFGSVRSEATLHWLGGGLLYLGAVVYIGGPYFAAVALPAVAGTLAACSGLADDTLVEVPLVAVLLTYMAATFRLAASGHRNSACAHCQEHLREGSSYCSSCGTGLAPPSVKLGRAKVGIVILTSLLILGLTLAQPVAFNVTQGGINYTTYTLSGIHVQPLIDSLPAGWRVANMTEGSSSTGTSMTYDLASARTEVSLVIALSSNTYESPSTVPANFSRPSLVGNVVVSNQTLREYGLTKSNGSGSFTGLAWTAPISYLSGGQVSTGLFSFLAAEPTAAYNATGGRDLTAISSALLERVGVPQSWSLPLGTIGNYILGYESFIIPSVGLIAVLLFVGSLRSRELRESRVVDNSFGLSPKEFALFAALAQVGRSATGVEYEAAAVKKGVWNAGDFCAELARLQRLGLMSSHVRARGGLPRLFWKCELA